MKRFVAAVVLLVGMTACAPRETAAPVTAADDAAPHDGGTVVRRLDAGIATVNPVLAESRYDRLVDNYLFTPLLTLDEHLRPAPGLATKWEVSPDGREYTFSLDERATFSDGTPVRASDVLFTLRRIADPEGGAVQVGAGFEGIDLARTRAVDDHTVVVAFAAPLSSQLMRFNDVLVIPEHVYSKGDFKNDFNTRAVGSGPYRISSIDRNQQIVLLRREDYWGAKPHLQRVVVKIISDTNTAWNALRTNQIDETSIHSDLWFSQSRRPEMTRQIDFRRFYTLNTNVIAWNGRNPLFADRRVRRALGMCVDLPSLIANLYHGTARALSGPFTPDQYAYNPAVPVLPFDPPGARQLLASAGWRDSDGDGVLDRNGARFEFDFLIFGGSATAQPFAELLQEELRQIGVVMNPVRLDPSTMLGRMLEGDYAAGYMSFDLDPEPDVFPILHSSQFAPKGQNFVFYANPEADRLMEAARRELDQGERQKIYHRLHEVLAADQPFTWTVQVSEKWAISRRLRNVKESRGWGLFTWYPGELDWWIPRDQRIHDGRAGAAPSR